MNVVIKPIRPIGTLVYCVAILFMLSCNIIIIIKLKFSFLFLIGNGSLLNAVAMLVNIAIP